MAVEKNNIKESDGLNLNDILTEIRLWVRLIKRNFKLFILIGIIGGGLGVLYATLHVPTYRANLRFMMRSDASGFASQLSSLNSLLGTGTGPTGTPIDRIMELIGTERVVANALLSKATIDNKEDLLINHYLRLNKLTEKWQKDTLLSKVSFSDTDQFGNFNFTQRKAFRIIYGAMVGKNMTNGILGKSLEKKSAMITVSATHFNEDFSIFMANALYKELVNFYANEAVASTKRNVQILTMKADSIKQELDNTRSAFAQNTDKTLGILLLQNKVENKNLSVRENMLTLMYGEIQKNLETLRFIEQSSAPSFSTIDIPYSPIDPNRKSRTKFGLIGSVIPVLLLILIQRGLIYIKTLNLDFNVFSEKKVS